MKKRDKLVMKIVFSLLVLTIANAQAQKISTAWLDSLAHVKYSFKNMDSIVKVHESIDYEWNIDTLIFYISTKIESKNRREKNEAEQLLGNVPKDISFESFLKVLDLYEDVLLKRNLNGLVDYFTGYIRLYPQYAPLLDTPRQCMVASIVRKYPGKAMKELYGILGYDWRAPCLLQTVVDYLTPQGKYFDPQRTRISCRTVYNYLDAFNYPEKDKVLMDLFFMMPDNEYKWSGDYPFILENYLSPYVKERIYRFILTDSIDMPVQMSEGPATLPVYEYIWMNVQFETDITMNNLGRLIDRQDTAFRDSMFYYYRKMYRADKELQNKYYKRSPIGFQIAKLREYIQQKLASSGSDQDNPSATPVQKTPAIIPKKKNP